MFSKKKPGIHSARWGGKKSDFNKAMQRVYKELDKKDKEWRTKKISKILIGTNNRGKLREIANLLPKKVKVFSTKDFNLKSPNETGKTFKSNALIKAKYF